MLTKSTPLLLLHFNSRRVCQGALLRCTRRALSSVHNFDLATAVRPPADASSTTINAGINQPASTASFQGFVSDKYSIADAPNGGYLSCMAVSASRRFASEVLSQSQPHLQSLTCYFNSKATENAPADLIVEALSASKSTLITSVKIRQLNTLRCSFTMLFSDLDKLKGLTNISPAFESFSLPQLSECIDATSILRPMLGKKLVKIQNEIDILVPPSDPFNLSTLERARSHNLFSYSPISKDASQSGYVRFSDGRPIDSDCLAFFCDALPPPILNVSPSPWVPTLEYNVNILDKPNPVTDQWLRFHFCTPYAKNGLLITEGRLFSQDGSRLLAISRQLARHIEMPAQPAGPSSGTRGSK